MYSNRTDRRYGLVKPVRRPTPTPQVSGVMNSSVDPELEDGDDPIGGGQANYWPASIAATLSLASGPHTC